jgi:hypothetical protein
MQVALHAAAAHVPTQLHVGPVALKLLPAHVAPFIIALAAACREKVSLGSLVVAAKGSPAPRDFISAIKAATARTGKPGLIAEVRLGRLGLRGCACVQSLHCCVVTAFIVRPWAKNWTGLRCCNIS